MAIVHSCGLKKGLEVRVGQEVTVGTGVYRHNVIVTKVTVDKIYVLRPGFNRVAAYNPKDVGAEIK